jgi:hypothetical protein
MANKTITELANALVSPAAGDLLAIWNVAQSRTDKITRANLIGATLTGGGTVATGGFTLTIGAASAINGTLAGGGQVNTGGFTLTVPATGSAALLAVSNVFTVAQGFAPTLTNALAISIVMPSGTSANAFKIELVSSTRIAMTATAGATQVELKAADYGATIGPAVIIERNTNAASAAGCLRMMNKTGTEYYIWVDATGDLRIGTTAPTSANDLTGAVVGTQS